jgi:hypothetical protein
MTDLPDSLQAPGSPCDESLSRERKPYTPPVLTEWGRLTDLTQGGAGIAPDFDFISTKAV